MPVECVWSLSVGPSCTAGDVAAISRALVGDENATALTTISHGRQTEAAA